MSIQLQFIGAARTVTGSRHLLRTSRATVLLDCGLFQGRRQESRSRNSELGFDPAAIDAVVLSHAHIDHSGALPMLVKRGFTGPIYATPATRDLCAVMLEDAAMIQVSDARYLNRAIERDGVDAEPIEPLYLPEDAERVLTQMLCIPYRRRQRVAEGVEVTFLDAGHVLGSAIVVLDVEDEGQTRRIVFTGDLGRAQMPILRDPEVASGAEVLITESTYGDRTHPATEELDDALADVVNRTHARGGRIVIPSFALERAQQIVYSLKKLRRANRIPRLPVYVDSPLAVNITEVFRLHPECYDSEARKLLYGGDSPFEFDGLRYVADREESIAIDRAHEPCIVISASGMCEAGRVLHHLRTTVENPRDTIVIVGFQAQHTLGRRLVERRHRVRIFGVERNLAAEVVVLNGFSAHADQSDLLSYAEAVRERGPLRQVFLVHGEPPAQQALRQGLEARGFPRVHVPAPFEVCEV
jgi:metallo-beta-lactamase family protein